VPPGRAAILCTVAASAARHDFNAWAYLLDVMERLAREAPAHARPREIILVPELPRTDTGKLKRFRLKEDVESHR
jgi:acyl-coenzyme A synthetase/AMP-(fatty) acid ligase